MKINDAMQIMGINLIFPLIVSILAAIATARLTVRRERRKTISEVQRTTYLNVLKLLSQIEENPTVIFEKDYMEKLQLLKIEMEVYANDDVKDQFMCFWKEIYREHWEYRKEFESEEFEETKKWYANSPALRDMFESMSDKADLDYRIQHMPNIKDVVSMTEKLKIAISKCLREG